ncbi:hypothetical protein DVH05_024504 [Phytophthora capsici]|nr:hypothetical protein DVH05_024504 [Phytophthora capsici]
MTRRGIPNRKWTQGSLFDSFQAADKFRKALEHRFVAVGQTKSLNGLTKIYACKDHLDCQARFRIRPERIQFPNQIQTDFVCQTSGEHSMELAEPPSRGIHPALMADIETMFASGSKPLGALAQLEAKQNVADKAIALPSIEQLRNRKGNWKRQKVEMKWRNLDHYDELFEWAASKICKTRGDMEAAGDCDLVVLSVFRSKELLQSLHVVFDCGDPISVSCDGTYKLHQGGWTLVNFGVMGVIYDSAKREFRQRFFPCLFGFVRTECLPAYQAIFSEAKRCAREFFGFDLQPATGSMDGCTSISSAYKSIWPGITLITCWPHVFRNCTTKTHALKDKAFMKKTIIPDLKRMHLSTSHRHFKALSKSIVNSWRKSGEGDFADEFEKTYLVAPFDSWYVGAAQNPGMLAQQQGIESYNKSIKNDMDVSLRATTSYFLENTIPLILKWSCKHRTSAEIRLFAEAPLLHDQLTKAAALQDPTKYYLTNHKTRETLYFNRSSHFKQKATKTLAARYDKYQDHSLYRVRVQHSTAFTGLQLEPTIQADTIKQFRTKYASAAINEDLNLKEAQTKTQERRRPGRPHKKLHCLVRDRVQATEAENDRAGGPDAKLRRRLTVRPSDALGLRVLHKFQTAEAGQTDNPQSSIFRGIVTSFQPESKPPTWTIFFQDDQTSLDLILSKLIEDLCSESQQKVSNCLEDIIGY